uniref:FadR/GntR family transcriptional regulator n=2 Tax=Bacilli TaxID=91061 RepID=UPI0030C8482F
VREALRALELLGLIETRRGEGTFIRDFRGNQLVQLLSTFILQDQKAVRDVIETKYLVEMDCLRLAVLKRDKNDFQRLKAWVNEHNVEDNDFFIRIADLADNHLIYRIWQILVDYYQATNREEFKTNKEDYLELVEFLEQGDIDRVLIKYRRLRNLSYES